jgi:exosortase/archaeosortase family protein
LGGGRPPEKNLAAPVGVTALFTTAKEFRMTATADRYTVPRRGLVTALRQSISRDELFAGLYILGCANGLLGRTIYALNLEGWSGVVAGVEMNVIVWGAAFAGLYLLITSSSRDQIQRLDLVVAAIFLPFVMVPSYPLSWVAVTGLSVYVLLFANNGSQRRRGALILLALAFPMLWSRLFFQLLARPLLALDATMVTWLLGTERIGNLVRFADDSGYMLITPACTTFGSISYTFLCWITVTQWANHRWSSKDLLWISLMFAGLIATNITRMAVTGLSSWHYEVFHNQWEEMILGTVVLCFIIGMSVMGARRELFSRA